MTKILFILFTILIYSFNNGLIKINLNTTQDNRFPTLIVIDNNDDEIKYYDNITYKELPADNNLNIICKENLSNYDGKKIINLDVSDFSNIIEKCKFKYNNQGKNYY